MIEINNLTDFATDERFLKKIAQTVLKGEDKEKHTLSIALVKEREIRDLNKKYLKKDKATDVLSFSQISDFSEKISEKIKEFENILGEVIICPKVVKKNSKDFNIVFKKEMAKVLIHGILHLLGYEHEKSDKKLKEMQEKENYYLSLCFS